MKEDGIIEDKNNKSFNLYYLNLNKVYELSMMINNVVATNIQKEKYNSTKKSKSIKASIGGTIEADSNYLSSIKSVIGSNRSSEYSSSSKLIENLDIKTTKSILLNRIKEKCISTKQLENCKEGDLIEIDNINLSILDRTTLQQMLLLKRDALKGIKVEGIDINNIIASMIKDYSYILVGASCDTNDKIIIKIPFEMENEFENNYSVDDVLLGKVSLIGIYKSRNKLSDIASNTFNYFTNIGVKEENSSKIIQSNYDLKSEPLSNVNSTEEYHYIDIIAIIQEVHFKEEAKTSTIPWYKRLFKNKKKVNNEK